MFKLMINLNITFNYWDNYNEKSLVDNYILFSTDTTIYVKYTKIKIEDDEQSELMSEFFNFSKLEIVNNFINKRFKQIKQNERLDLSDVIFDLYKNRNVLMSDQLDWEFTGFFKFQKLLNEYVNFIKYMNIVLEILIYFLKRQQELSEKLKLFSIFSNILSEQEILKIY